MKYVALAIAVAVLFFSPALTRPAFAVCATPAGTAGTILYNSSQKIFQYCNDTSWMNMGQPGTGSGGCASPTLNEGGMTYNADYRILQGCAGATHQGFGPVGGEAKWSVLSVGSTWACGVRSDGALLCWGDSQQGNFGDASAIDISAIPLQTNKAGPWKSVSSRDEHACAIKADEHLYCWGRGDSGRLGNNANSSLNTPTEVVGGGTWKQIATGSSHSCGIKTDDTIWCWGLNLNGRLGDNSTTNRLVPTAINGGGTWKMVSAGTDATCAIKSDDTIWCWGRGNRYQRGDNSVADSLVPVSISGGGAWKRVSAGNQYACAIKSDDTLHCWGLGSGGRLGNGATTDNTIPTAVTGGGAWAWVGTGSPGASHTCGVKTDGTLHCWGSNTSGQLGDGTLTQRTVPTASIAGSDWLAVSAGVAHTCAMRTNGAVQCWGETAGGRLGDNGSEHLVSPTPISSPEGWSGVGAGDLHSCAIKSNDTLWCWGSNATGQLGDNSTTQRLVPTAINGGGAWGQVSTGSTHSCAIKSDDSLWCWGSDSDGQLGNGAGVTSATSPVQETTAATNWVSVTTGTAYTCAIKTDGSAWCWGGDFNDKLGNGAVLTADQHSPGAVTGGATWSAISAGEHFTCGVRTDGSAWCWGEDGAGQLGNGATTGNQPDPVAVTGGATWSAISAGNNHVCGIQTDGTLHCWGRNANGQLGDNSTTNRLVPTAVNGGGTWKSVAAGTEHTCGIKSDDTLWCWGLNTNGRLGDGTITQRLVPTAVAGGGTWSIVATGGTHTCAVAMGSGQLYCWGSNSNAQTTATEFSAPYKMTASRMWCNDPPAKPGGMVYNTDTDVIQYCDSAGWVSVGGTAPELVAVPDGLIGYWKFDETTGTTAADSSGNNMNGALTNMDGNTDWVAGHRGNALDFDGANDYVSVTSAPMLDNIKPVSACAWIYRRTPGNAFPTILDKSTTGMDGFNFYMDSAKIGYYSNDGDYKAFGTLSLNTWYHVCYTYSGSGAGTTSADIKLYLDGVELSPGAAANVNATPSDDSLYNLTIGSGATNAYPYNGMIDEVRLYNRVLSLTEIQALAAQ